MLRPGLHRVDVLFGIWALWGCLLMALAHTDIIAQPWFYTFRFWVGQVVPTVNHPPVQGIMDPKIASSFLAMLWATSPTVWIGFRRMPAERLFLRCDWSKPFSSEIMLVVGMVTICGIVAFSNDFGGDTLRLANRGLANSIGFAVIAGLLAALPWYALALVNVWRAKVNEYFERQERG